MAKYSISQSCRDTLPFLRVRQEKGFNTAGLNFTVTFYPISIFS